MKDNKLILTIILFLITLALIFFFVWPEYQQSQNLSTTISKAKTEYQGEYAYYADISNLLTNIQSNPDYLQKINNALPSDFSYASLVNFFQQQGSETGLVVKSIVFAPVVAAGTGQSYATVSFSVDVMGNYPAFKNFIASLDTSSRIFDIESISFAAPIASTSVIPTGLAATSTNTTPVSQAPIYNFNLSIQTYTY